MIFCSYFVFIKFATWNVSGYDLRPLIMYSTCSDFTNTVEIVYMASITNLN